LRHVIVALATGALISSPAAAQPDYCGMYASSMSPGELYQVKCPTPNTCQTHLVGQSNFPVQRGSNDRFLYKTAETPVQNSLVIIQFQYVGTEPHKSASAVSLARQRVDFACFRGGHAAVRDAVPVDPDDVGHAPSVTYGSYDKFHRTGGADSWGDRQTLESFHVHYFNGNACVRTTDDGRRQQFLFERREEQEGYFSTLVARLNIPQFSTPAVAGPEVLKYEKLHVLLGNYKKKPLTSGCVSFSVPAQGSALDIVLSDIEDNVLHNSVAPTKTWSLNVY
jgi:hypothetical protein